MYFPRFWRKTYLPLVTHLIENSSNVKMMYLKNVQKIVQMVLKTAKVFSPSKFGTYVSVESTFLSSEITLIIFGSQEKF